MSADPETDPIFLSHSHGDSDWAKEVAGALERAGMRVWLDIAEIRPGERIAERLREELRRARTIVVLLSPDSARSPWTYFEIGAAVADGKRILPVLSPGMEPGEVPGPLRGYQWIRWTDPDELGRQVARALGRAAS